MVKLFVVGIPRTMQEIALLELFMAEGQVEMVKIVTDIDTGESKGYAFVHMTDQAGADRAIAAFDGMEIETRQLSVRIAEDKRASAQKPSPVASKPSFESPGYHKVEKPDGSVKKKRPRRTF
ncbi:hypothetical protein [Mucilaginibacter sp.]|uniref:RNA recognition motif domain-containing protein n=1 Tax=Mucilaginibacter sp. TaxID=1882438 RepID=UPI0025EC3F54|nr:hypothetical protein [Mucilaginibacter sp.]